MDFRQRLFVAQAIMQARAEERGFVVPGNYASVSAFNQNDEGIWRNGTGDGIKPDRDDFNIGRGQRFGQLFSPRFGG